MAGAQFVALIRGINVGSKARLSMPDLRELLTADGYRDVRTLLQSGNVVLRASANTKPATLERKLEASILAEFGLTVSVLVRTEKDFRAALATNPLAELADDGRKMQIVFLSGDPHPDLLAAHDPVALDPERIVRDGRTIYQWCPTGILDAPSVNALVERKLRLRATARNWNTLEKIRTLLDG